jgi:tetratricopeptide (TPR) repeat protein
MCAGLVFGLLAKVFSYPFEVSAYGAATIVCASYFLQAWFYCRLSAKAARERTPTLIARRWYLLATGIACGLLAFLPEPSVEAAILDRRLRKLSRGSPLSDGEAEEIKETLGRAQALHVDLSISTKIQVRDAVKTSALREPKSPFTDAANALVSYVREVKTATPPPSEAAIAMESAARLGLAAIRPQPTGDVLVNRQEAEASIDALTRAIGLSGSDTSLRSDALLIRAGTYAFLGKADEAQRDLDAAEKLGAADLSEIVSTEALALVTRGNPDDLRRAVTLLTLAIQLPAPKERHPRLEWDYRIDLYSQRASSYLRLGQFSEAIGDLRKMLDLLKKSLPLPGLALHCYIAIIASYLLLGDIAEALKATTDWEQGTNDSRAAQVRELIQSNPSEALKALASFDPLKDFNRIQ